MLESITFLYAYLLMIILQRCWIHQKMLRFVFQVYIYLDVCAVCVQSHSRAQVFFFAQVVYGKRAERVNGL